VTSAISFGETCLDEGGRRVPRCSRRNRAALQWTSCAEVESPSEAPTSPVWSPSRSLRSRRSQPASSNPHSIPIQRSLKHLKPSSSSRTMPDQPKDKQQPVRMPFGFDHALKTNAPSVTSTTQRPAIYPILLCTPLMYCRRPHIRPSARPRILTSRAYPPPPLSFLLSLHTHLRACRPRPALAIPRSMARPSFTLGFSASKRDVTQCRCCGMEESDGRGSFLWG